MIKKKKKNTISKSQEINDKLGDTCNSYSKHRANFSKYWKAPKNKKQINNLTEKWAKDLNKEIHRKENINGS